VDSAYILAMASSIRGAPVPSFTVSAPQSVFDETQGAAATAHQIGSSQTVLDASAEVIAANYAKLIEAAESPVLDTSCAALLSLSREVQKQGNKVVITGEGADETFAGYDVFREGKVRRFWARFPDSRMRPLILERLYPYLARSPVSARAMARQFFGRNLAHHDLPGFAHDLRWHTTASLQHLFSEQLRDQINGHDAIATFLATLPEAFGRWSALAQDQYIEIRTLLSGYLLSSQGDRMLMAHSIEGRFPFLDREVVGIADSLPPEYKLRGLDEKHVLKRVAQNVVPDQILKRKKQPYRAPDALSFLGDDTPDYVEDILDAKNVELAGVFDSSAVERLWRKCKARAGAGQFSNTDNMALVGVLSTQLVHHHFIRHCPGFTVPARLSVDIDRVMSGCHVRDTRRRTAAT